MFVRAAGLLLQAVALGAAVKFVFCKLFRELLSDVFGAAGKVCAVRKLLQGGPFSGF